MRNDYKKTLRNRKRIYVNMLVMSIVLLLGMVSVGETCQVKAAENESMQISEETTEPEKELVLYNDGWVGLRYTDEYGDIWLDLSYNGKSVVNLQELGYIVEAKTYEDYPDISLAYTDWGLITDYFSDIISSEKKDSINTDSFTHPEDNMYQFRIIDSNGNIVSTSEKAILKSDVNFPIVISANPVEYEYYNFQGQSIKMTLKFSEQLNLVNTSALPSFSTSVSKFSKVSEVLKPFFTTNLQYENFSENVIVDGTNYIWDYSIVTFICNFPRYEYTTPADGSNRFKFALDNLCGLYTNNSPNDFHYYVSYYTDSSKYQSPKTEFTEEEYNLEVGASTEPSVNILDDTISQENFSYITSDETIASVSADGIVTAKADGEAYIYVCNGDDIYDYCLIKVGDSRVGDSGDNEDDENNNSNIEQDTMIPVDGLSLNFNSKTLKTGENCTLTATIQPSNATNKSVTWSTSDSSIATVDNNGKVTAKKAGTVTITATSNDNKNIYASCKVSVINPVYKVNTLTLTTATKNVKVGSKIKLNCNVSPSNATNKAVTWKTSNSKYATVDANGYVTIKAAGAGKTVTITAIAKDGSNIQKSITLNIQKVKVKKIKLTGKKQVKAGKKITLKAVVKPTNATVKKLKWKVSNNKYATITKKGVLKAKKAGKGKKVKVSVYATDGSGIKATITIKIK